LQTIVYMDGFNLYYGACRAAGRRWLNPLALAQRLLPNDEIVEIGYFTANIKRDPEDPGAQDRQRLYHRALQTIPNLEIFLGRYISKQVRGELVDATPDELPKRTVLTYEEKGTDVNLATRLLLDGFNRRYESAAVISNDGDLKMPIQVVREELDLHVTVVNPVLHSKHRSAALSPDPLPPNASFIRLSARDVIECQFPEQVISPKGARLIKPETW
jgi:NYN domain